MVDRERNSSVSRKERAMWSLLIGFAIIGVVAIGLVAGGFLKTIPSMMTAARVRRVLNGTTPVQDFPITCRWHNNVVVCRVFVPSLSLPLLQSLPNRVIGFL